MVVLFEEHCFDRGLYDRKVADSKIFYIHMLILVYTRTRKCHIAKKNIYIITKMIKKIIYR